MKEPAFFRRYRELIANRPPVAVVQQSTSTTMQVMSNESALKKLRKDIDMQELQRNLQNYLKCPTPLSETVPRDDVLTNATKTTNGSHASASKVSLKKQRESLPIFNVRQQFLKAFAENQILIVVGETGSGKTTQMTQYLAEIGYVSPSLKIGCTQPRRVAAISAANRVAEEYGCEVGREVGYCIRFDDRTTPDCTIIKYMTDGVLLRDCLFDPDLDGYAVIILDEAHERSMHTDVLFGLLKAIARRRPDLKVIVTSATLDAEKFSTFFCNAPVFEVPGRTFPVEVVYSPFRSYGVYVDASLEKIIDIHRNEPPGDILLFLTGQEEIDLACESLNAKMRSSGTRLPELIILPVYSALPSELQSRIFDPPPPGARKVVIATNIAETSLTIDGVRYVIDPGFAKQRTYNASNGIDKLENGLISRAQADQRKGRAGRTGPGKCYRLYTEGQYNHEMTDCAVPEIQRSSLFDTVIQLMAMGVEDLLTFEFMDPPPAELITDALHHLYLLGAVDENAKLTSLGRRMANLPLEPVLSKMLIMSVDLGCSEEIVTIIAMLTIQHVFFCPKKQRAIADRKKAQLNQPGGDHLTLLKVHNEWRKHGCSGSWCDENFVQSLNLQQAEDARQQLLRIMERSKLEITSCGSDMTLVRKAICSSFFLHAASTSYCVRYAYQTAFGQSTFFIHPSSSLFQRRPRWVIYDRVVFTSKAYMRELTEIDPAWLVEFAPACFKRK